MSKLVNESFVDTELVVAFKTPSDLGKQFPFKDKVDQNTLVVYHLKCGTAGCEANYIGKTKRNLDKRVEEHAKTDTAISQHCNKLKHVFDFEKVKILDRADNDSQLQLKEMLHIRNLAPTLNVQDESTLFTLIIRNAQKKTDLTNDRQKYARKNKTTSNKNN